MRWTQTSWLHLIFGLKKWLGPRRAWKPERGNAGDWRSITEMVQIDIHLITCIKYNIKIYMGCTILVWAVCIWNELHNILVSYNIIDELHVVYTVYPPHPCAYMRVWKHGYDMPGATFFPPIIIYMQTMTWAGEAAKITWWEGDGSGVDGVVSHQSSQGVRLKGGINRKCIEYYSIVIYTSARIL